MIPLESIAFTPHEIDEERTRWLNEKIAAIIRQINTRLVSGSEQGSRKHDIEFMCSENKNDATYLPPHSHDLIARKVNEAFVKAGWNSDIRVAVAIERKF
jgi:hypothetical protein